MDPSTQFCPNAACPDRGQRGQGNIGIPSQKEQRYVCATCGRTFAATTGTVHYRLRTDPAVVTQVVTLLCHGCPVQAIVAAFGLDERTVAAWQQRAGAHCQRVHEHLVQAGHVDLGHVQADELWIKMHKGRVWPAMAISVAARLWLGGVLSVSRDRALLRTMAQQIRACACRAAVLICVDGLAGYARAMGNAFRVPRPTGKPGRPPLERPQDMLLAQVIKKYAQRRVVSVTHRVVFGTADAVAHVLAATHSGTVINTAYSERLNATFRACLAPLARRTRALAHQVPTLTAGMFLVGTTYNFCWPHHSLRQRARGAGRKWVDRTPAMAAGLTDHCWTMHEVLTYQVPLPRWVAPKRRGRPPKTRPAAPPTPKRRGRPPKQLSLAVAA